MENIRDYAAIPHEYLKEMEVLSDAEFGRLVRFILAYSMKGTPIDLRGNERFFANRVTAREDRFQQSYLESQEKLSAAGQKAAIARWSNAKDTNACDRMPSDTNACDAMRSDAIHAYPNPNLNPNPNPDPKENTATRSARSRTRAQGYEQAVSEAFGDREALKTAVLRWLAYKQERKQPYEATGLKTLLTRIRNHADESGDAAVISLIETSIGNNWQGIYFERLEKPKMPGSSRHTEPVDVAGLEKLLADMRGA